MGLADFLSCSFCSGGYACRSEGEPKEHSVHTFCEVHIHFSSRKFFPSRSPCLFPFFVRKRHVSSSQISQDEAGRSSLSSQVP